jgi:hypothetical protein
MPVVGSIDLKRRFVVRIVERVAEHYDIEEREFGRVYRWRPASVVVECYCGEKSSLTLSKTACQVCGSNLAEAVRGKLSTQEARARDEELHPWRYARDREGIGLPC